MLIDTDRAEDPTLGTKRTDLVLGSDEMIVMLEIECGVNSV